jgi:CubicO group peptidase (beta-lactamase class C family)
MRIKHLAITTSITIFLQACGGGGGGSSSSEPVVTNPIPPSFESPHPTVWETASASEAGFDAALLEDAFDYALTDGYYTQGALVIKQGKLIDEAYRGITLSEAQTMAASAANPAAQEAAFWQDIYSDRDASSPITSWSTAKSFTSMLIGIAIDEGHIESSSQLASDFIDEWASDDRANITIQQLLDMRSGLVPMCSSPLTQTTSECQDYLGASSGGNIVFVDDQLSACIERELATPGAAYPWIPPWQGGGYEGGQFLYSNCDTQVLGEIVYRATGQDPGLYAQQKLFEPLNISANWWRDNVEEGQSNGNFLNYCCLDSTARDFAKFGYMLLLGGIVTEAGTNYASYVATVLAQNELYKNQFWASCADEGVGFEDCGHILISTRGFDGQYILVDQLNDLVLVRTSLYEPFLNHSDERKMRFSPIAIDQSNWTGSVPMAMGGAGTEFRLEQFHSLVVAALSEG